MAQRIGRIILAQILVPRVGADAHNPDPIARVSLHSAIWHEAKTLPVQRAFHGTCGALQFPGSVKYVHECSSFPLCVSQRHVGQANDGQVLIRKAGHVR